MDGLLNKLYSSRNGCRIGSHFCGALAYANDIVLLARAAAAMRTMLKICEDYAQDFDVIIIIIIIIIITVIYSFIKMQHKMTMHNW